MISATDHRLIETADLAQPRKHSMVTRTFSCKRVGSDHKAMLQRLGWLGVGHLGKIPCVTRGKELRYHSHESFMGKSYRLLHLGLLMA